MIVFYEDDAKAFAWLRYYNKGGWVYFGPKILGGMLKNGASPTIGDTDEKILLTDSREKLEHDLPLVYDSPYLWCSVLSDDFDPDSVPPVAAGDSPGHQPGSVPATQPRKRQMKTKINKDFSIVLSDDLPMANDARADGLPRTRTPDDIVAVLGFDPDDEGELTGEKNTRSQRTLDNVTEEQPARKPTALKKTSKRKSSVRKVKK